MERMGSDPKPGGSVCPGWKGVCTRNVDLSTKERGKLRKHTFSRGGPCLEGHRPGCLLDPLERQAKGPIGEKAMEVRLELLPDTAYRRKAGEQVLI